MVTSQLNGLSFPGDTLLDRWREAGLPKPSMVRLAKVVTVEHSLIRKKLGTVQGVDQEALRQQFRRLLAEAI